ncbi:MAG: glutamate decarboxylase [Cryomorphaceae bacterium]|nr:MAG: glutamate decarboxylase [Cryomorphaceae bacterium]
MEDHRKVLAETFDIIQEYIDSLNNPAQKVNEFMLPEALKSRFDFELRANGTPYNALLDFIRQYLHLSVKTGSKQYLNQLFGGLNLPALLGEFITSLSNTSMYTYEVAPVATLMEMEIVRKMNSFTRFTHGDGTFLTGGSNTNLVAMITARNHLFPEGKEKGMAHLPTLTAFVSERSHFSFTKAANAIGLGTQNLKKVAVDNHGKICSRALTEAIEASLNRGEVPFFIGATCGTTEMGAFDNLAELVPVARRYNMWLHADGSWGGSAIMSPNWRHLFNGIEQCDSFSWNPHKLMNIPLICSVLLVKDASVLREALSSDDTSYIYHNDDSSQYDLGPKSLQCGKRVDSLKLWLAWKYFGDEGYVARINHLFALAQYATSVIEQHPRLELMCPTQTLNVNFRYVPASGDEADKFNHKIRQSLVESGKSMVNYCHLPNGLSIRLILLNPDLEKSDIDRFFRNYLTEAKMIEEKSVTKV